MDRRELLKIVALALGTSVSSSCSRAILSGGDVDRAVEPTLFDEPQRRKVAQLAELIIPQTDTAGAIQAGVPDFIQRVVTQWYTADERAAFIQGLADLDAASRVAFGATFVGSSNDQQAAMLQAFEAKAPSSAERAFFLQIKELTVLGYYTSEVGSQQELLYRPVPGAYHGHATLGATSRQWTQ